MAASTACLPCVVFFNHSDYQIYLEIFGNANLDCTDFHFHIFNGTYADGVAFYSIRDFFQADYVLHQNGIMYLFGYCVI